MFFILFFEIYKMVLIVLKSENEYVFPLLKVWW